MDSKEIDTAMRLRTPVQCGGQRYERILEYVSWYDNQGKRRLSAVLLPKFVCSDCGKVFWGRDGSQIRCGLCEAKARDDERRRRTMEERHWREVSRGLRRET